MLGCGMQHADAVGFVAVVVIVDVKFGQVMCRSYRLQSRSFLQEPSMKWKFRVRSQLEGWCQFHEMFLHCPEHS